MLAHCHFPISLEIAAALPQAFMELGVIKWPGDSSVPALETMMTTN